MQTSAGPLSARWVVGADADADAGHADDGGGELAGVLVRPDGVVCWAADAGGPDAGRTDGALPGSLARALARWAGAPAAPGGQ